MKLCYAAGSPFARNAMVAALVLGLAGKVETVSWDEGMAWNPLKKAPAMKTDDGEAIFDSHAICDWLNEVAGGNRLIPAGGKARLAVMRREVLGSGIMEAAVSRYYELRRPDGEKSMEWAARQEQKIAGAIDALEAEAAAGTLRGLDDLGAVSAACALEFLDRRYEAFDWRKSHKALAAWYGQVSALPAIRESDPPTD
ncbi:MAG: glutathione S-transferase N-terminal domain-containing protein [Alphaproteobacteria bacterium]